MANVVQAGITGLLTAIFYVLDIVTYLPYYVVQRPDLKKKKSARRKAVCIGDDPGGPYRSTEVGEGELWTTLDPDCKTLDDLLAKSAREFSSRPCLGTREVYKEEEEKQPDGKVFKKLVLGNYHWITFEEVLTRATNFGSGLLALGQRPRKNTLIFAETQAEWMIAAQACFKYNFPVVTLYATLGLDAIVHGVNESEVSFVITSASLLSKFREIFDKMPKLTHLIYIGKEEEASTGGFPRSIKVLAMEEVEELGAEPENIRTPVTKPRPDDLAVIMYTSGSTGKPKGVLITHGNLMSGMSGQCEKIVGLGPDDVYVGYLPLAHVLELSAEISCLAHGTSIGYSSPQTLTDKSTKIKRGCEGDLTVLKPTLMAAVPVIMDRLYKGVGEKVQSKGILFQALFNFAYNYKMRAIEAGFETPILDRLIFQKIRNTLGGRIRMMLSGGAPLSAKTQRFMNVCFCCPVLQGYGLTETCGAGTIAEVTDMTTGRVGAVLTCSEIQLRDWEEGNYTTSDTPHPRGEILVGGGNIVLGYHEMEEKTKEDFTKIGGIRYFCTGDIGEIDDDGALLVIDRKKDLVKLQAGEYVAINTVETTLKMCPLVEQIYVHGSSDRSYVVTLVVPNKTNLQKLASDVKVSDESMENLCQNKKVKQEFLKRLNQHGTKSRLEKYCLPQRIYLEPEPWTPEGGLVTDSYKHKRKMFEKHYEKEIKAMYEE